MSAKQSDFSNNSGTLVKIALGLSVGFIAGYVFRNVLANCNDHKHRNININFGETKYRRIVTGHDKNGKAIVVINDSIPNRLNPKVRTTKVFNVWRCECHNESNKNMLDLCCLDSKAIPLEPPLNGSNFRIIEFHPENGMFDNTQNDRNIAKNEWKEFGVLNDSVSIKNASHPFMHRTKSIDYAVCLYGQILMVLDDSEILVKAGDVVVQRGTNHAWKNCFDDTCIMSFVLIDADQFTSHNQ